MEVEHWRVLLSRLWKWPSNGNSAAVRTTTTRLIIISISSDDNGNRAFTTSHPPNGHEIKSSRCAVCSTQGPSSASYPLSPSLLIFPEQIFFTYLLNSHLSLRRPTARTEIRTERQTDRSGDRYDMLSVDEEEQDDNWSGWILVSNKRVLKDALVATIVMALENGQTFVRPSIHFSRLLLHYFWCLLLVGGGDGDSL